jgi:hypothetical protein
MRSTLMRLVRYGMLFGILLVSSCKNGPKVSVCISKPDSGGFVCVDPEDNTFMIEYQNSDKMVAFSPEDAEKLISSCGVRSSERKMVMSRFDEIETIASGHR